jgi:hypothetical protein
VARERERLGDFDMGVKMREEAVAEHKQELVLCHNGPLLDLLTCISFECFVLYEIDSTQFSYSLVSFFVRHRFYVSKS